MNRPTIANMPFAIIRLIVLIPLCLLSLLSFSKAKADFRIGLILPFHIDATNAKLDAFASAHDFSTASRVTLPQDAVAALDFYQGLVQALDHYKGELNVKLFVYDNESSDSLTREILKKEELKQLDVIIGTMSSSTARLIADFCKRNRITNIQPFTPSKSLTSSNPYHLKLSPTIDSHLDMLFQSVVDSFAGANVIIYSPNNTAALGAATLIDSLFTNYNKSAERKFSVVKLNSKDMTWNGRKTSVREELRSGKTNVLFITSFEESFVNGTLRVLFDSQEKYDLVVCGMPSWLEGDVLRLDYVNHFSTRLTHPFSVDSSRTITLQFIENYSQKYNSQPTMHSFLGYDVMNFLLTSFSDYGHDFLSVVTTQRFKGTAYIFEIGKSMYLKPAEPIPGTSYPATDSEKAINYYENKHVFVFRVRDYELERVK